MERNGQSTEGLNRYYGAVAEDFEDAGLEEYVIYNKDGEIENFMNRAWTLLIPNINDIKEEISELEKRLNELEAKNEL